MRESTCCIIWMSGHAQLALCPQRVVAQGIGDKLPVHAGRESPPNASLHINSVMTEIIFSAIYGDQHVRAKSCFEHVRHVCSFRISSCRGGRNHGRSQGYRVVYIAIGYITMELSATGAGRSISLKYGDDIARNISPREFREAPAVCTVFVSSHQDKPGSGPASSPDSKHG